jgi:hypothetical protein
MLFRAEASAVHCNLAHGDARLISAGQADKGCCQRTLAGQCSTLMYAVEDVMDLQGTERRVAQCIVSLDMRARPGGRTSDFGPLVDATPLQPTLLIHVR